MEIGFVGLGNMGRGMAANLIKAGHRVTVYNRSPAKSEALVRLALAAAGGQPVGRPVAGTWTGRPSRHSQNGTPVWRQTTPRSASAPNIGFIIAE